MNYSLLFSAMALMLVFEGIVPFLSPKLWQKLVEKFSLKDERSIRLAGLASMLIGMFILAVVHHIE